MSRQYFCPGSPLTVEHQRWSLFCPERSLELVLIENFPVQLLPMQRLSRRGFNSTPWQTCKPQRSLTRSKQRLPRRGVLSLALQPSSARRGSWLLPSWPKRKKSKSAFRCGAAISPVHPCIASPLPCNMRIIAATYMWPSSCWPYLVCCLALLKFVPCTEQAGRGQEEERGQAGGQTAAAAIVATEAATATADGAWWCSWATACNCCSCCTKWRCERCHTKQWQMDEAHRCIGDLALARLVSRRGT